MLHVKMLFNYYTENIFKEPMAKLLTSYRIYKQLYKINYS